MQLPIGEQITLIQRETKITNDTIGSWLGITGVNFCRRKCNGTLTAAELEIICEKLGCPLQLKVGNPEYTKEIKNKDLLL